MRHLPSLLLLLAAPAAHAQDMVRNGSPQSPISSSVEVPAGSRLVYVSGTVPDPVDASDPNAFGDTAAQTRSILRKIQAQLRQHRLDLGDVVMMRVFLVAPPGAEAMDFAGMMTAYREFFGTAEQPNKPARSTMEVAGLVHPNWLVEIEVTASAPASPTVRRLAR